MISMAIYGDQMELCDEDFEENWTPLECIITLWPQSGDGLQRINNGPSIDLHISCPFEYPFQLPLIELKNPKMISFNDTKLLLQELHRLAKDLKGEVMIFELAQYVENYLCSINIPQFESFYEEMIIRNKEIKENEQLKRKADEEKKLNDIKLKIKSEQQAVRKALRRKSKSTSVFKLAPDNSDTTSELPPLQKDEELEKKLQNEEVRSSHSCEEIMPWKFPNGTHSRFKNEFTHIKWLGQGAYGEVLKVRNKLDDGLYAIKRIELNPNKKQLYKKITREVKLLSRLNHENVVRYYNSWLEIAVTEDSNSESTTNSLTNEPTLIKSPEKLLSIPKKKGWILDKVSESISDDSSDDTWIQFKSPSKSSIQEVETILTANSSKEQSCHSIPQLLHMYIQMEFCENSTLRTAIDEGLFTEVDRQWRLFREIVEGICHIHSQGIIHRDLKPVNIFIGCNDHVKIGDFGLATSILRQKKSAVELMENISKSGSTITISSNPSKDISHTGQVGTAYYVAPEIKHTSRKLEYNQKVDIFSLGIIMFEMCHPPFTTAMERSKVMNNIRLENTIFPADFTYDINSNQCLLIRWMLQHNVDKRPNSRELLQSELIPPAQLEGEVKEMVRRTLLNPQSKDYKYLIASCFNQEMSPTMDATFNVSSWKSSWFLSLFEYISEIIRRIMRGHGAISFLPPILTPANDQPETAVSLMTRLGSIVYATFDIRSPFVRFLTHNPGISHMKRYAIDKVYRERPAGVHPKEIYECAFDIVTSTPGDLMPEFELISAAWEILCEFPAVLKRNTIFKLNHSHLLYAVLDYSGLDSEKCIKIAGNLFKTKSDFESNIDIKDRLKSYGIADNIVTTIFNLISTEGSFREVASALELLTATIPTVANALKHLETLIGYCSTLGITCPLIVSLSLLQNIQNYSGIMFHITYEQLSKQKQIENVLISGGRYDKLIRDANKLHSKDELKNEQYVCGFVLSIDKLISLFNDTEKQSTADVLLCTIRSFRMTSDRLNLIKDLWKSGLKTMFINSFQTLEEIQSFCQDMGIIFIVIFKESEPGFVRVRLPDRFSDKKIPYNELTEYIRRTKNKGIPDLQNTVSKVRETPLITFILMEKLNPAVKRRYEHQLLNVINPALQRLSSNTKVEIFVLTLESEALTLLSCCIDLNAAEQNLNNFTKRFPRYKKYVQKIVYHFEECKKSHNLPVIILYSLQDNVYKILF